MTQRRRREEGMEGKGERKERRKEGQKEEDEN
jgi:hypothetical protein